MPTASMFDSATPGAAVWAGRVLSTLVVLALVVDGSVGLLFQERLAPAMQETGFPPSTLAPISGICLACALVYAIPQTSLIGAILVTAFLGGAICAHLRIGEFGSPPQIVCVAIGIAAWAGVYLRSAPFRRSLAWR